MDGFDNTPLFAMAASWYQGLKEGQRHIFLSRHCYQPALLVYSKKWFDTLPKEIQEVITMPHDLTVWGRNQVRRSENPVLLKNLERYGYESDRSHGRVRAGLAFKGLKQKGVPDRIAKEMGPEGVALLKAIPSDILSVAHETTRSSRQEHRRFDSSSKSAAGARQVPDSPPNGAGAFATVYEAYDTIEGIPIALKVPNLDQLDKESLNSIQREVRLTARLDHENILPLRNAMMIDGHFVIATPLASRH